jgi:hypothetical protein
LTCNTSTYCDYMDNRCGDGVGTGMCRTRVQVCAAVIDQVCGCDGQIYNTVCAASAAGVDIDETGGCAAPSGTFACGPRFCMKGTQFCERTFGGPAGAAGGFICRPLPSACTTPATCACLSATTCGGTCTMSSAGDLTTTCNFP